MGDDNRPQWSNKIEYMLTTIGYSVGIGNMLRFPYLCLENGGGAFLIPYFFFMLVCGIPLFLCEMSMGQYCRLSVVGIWNFAPIFKGIGWCMVVISGFLSCYYVTLLAWILFYLGYSMRSVLPWTYCNNTWNTDFCYSYSDILRGEISPEQLKIYRNGSDKWRTSAEEFYLFEMLKISSSISDIGGINWYVFLCFILAWIISFLCIIKSTQSVGKVVYVTATLPYILITVFIIQGSLLPGSLNGIKFYLIPKWSTLLTFKVWITAAGQIFYSLGPAWGGLIVMASYNEFHANLVKRAFILPIICCMTSVYGGFAIFSVVGYMAHVSKIENITEITDSGFGLAFVAYPQAISLLPGSVFWSICFFLTLFTLGIDSMFSTYETFLQGIIDEVPALRGTKKYIFVCSSTVVLMCCGIIFTTRAGPYYYQIVDWYSSPIAAICIATLESVAITWFYNRNTMLKHIALMMRAKDVNLATKIWFNVCMIVLLPLSLFIILVGICYSFGKPKPLYGDPYPDWSIAMGWVCAAIVISAIPITALRQICIHRNDLRKLFKPNETFKKIMKLRSYPTEGEEIMIENESFEKSMQGVSNEESIEKSLEVDNEESIEITKV